MGLLPPFIAGLVDQKVEGHVTIAPPLVDRDFITIFSNPTHQTLTYWILKGEQSAWPFLCMIKCRTTIEKKLYQVRKLLEASREKKSDEVMGGLTRKKRTLSN